MRGEGKGCGSGEDGGKGTIRDIRLESSVVLV